MDNAMPAVLADRSAAQQSQLISTRDVPCDTYFAAVNKTLADNNSTVQKILGDLQTTQKEVDADLQGMRDIGATIQLVTNLVKLASSLALLAAA